METPEGLTLLKEKLLTRKKAKQDARKRALANGPCLKEFKAGENSLADWILLGVYQETIDADSISLLKQELEEFLITKPHLQSFLLIAALWINFWQIISPSFVNTLPKSLKIIEVNEKNWFDETSWGQYFKKNSAYFIAGKIYAFIHELKHAVDNFIYLNGGFPFFKNEVDIEKEWKTIVKKIVNEKFDQGESLFDFKDYPQEEWINEFSARMIQAEFLNIEFSQPEYREFSKLALQQFCEHAEINSNIIIKAMGLHLLKPFAANNLFKNGKIYLDQDTCKLLNSARSQNKTIITLEMERMLAAKNTPQEIVEFLLSQNISLNDISYSVKLEPTLQSVQLFVEKQFIYSEQFLAAETGDLAFLQNTIGKYADINTQDDEDYTLLHRAAEGNQPEVISWLIEQAADVNKLKEAYTPLFLAVKKNNKEAVTTLLKICKEKKLSLEKNTKDGDGRTPLHVTASKGYNEIGQLLLDYGAEVNTKDHNELTPLHLACAKGNVAMVKIFLNHRDININLKDNDDKTAFDYAKEYKHEEIINLFNVYKTKKIEMLQSPIRFFNAKTTAAANEKIEVPNINYQNSL